MYQAIEKETITVGALGVRFLVESDDSNGTASVFECYVPANSRMPAPHSHDGFEETIYGLEGITSWTIDGETSRSAPAKRVRQARANPRVSEPGERRRENALHRNSGGVRARLLPRDRRGPRRQRRRPPGPGRRLRSDAPPRPHPRTAQRHLTTTSCVSRSSPDDASRHASEVARRRRRRGAPGPANQSRSHHPSPDAEEGTSCHFKS